MRSPLSIFARIPLKRLAGSLAMAAGLIITGQVGLAAHASPIQPAHAALYDSPQINVNDEYWGPIGPHVFPVQGYGFTVNSPVVLELVGNGGRVVAEATTTARGVLTTRSASAATFRYRLTIPPAVTLPGLRLFAIDRATGRYSNTIAFHYPIPNCIHHPYTCF
jgi:hypothetical protein